MVRVTILPDRTVKEVQATTVSDVLTALGLHRDAHLVVRGEDILTSDERLAETDELEIVPVISGGGGWGGTPPASNLREGTPPASDLQAGAPPAGDLQAGAPPASNLQGAALPSSGGPKGAPPWQGN